jgi:hypothetical protein
MSAAIRPKLRPARRPRLPAAADARMRPSGWPHAQLSRGRLPAGGPGPGVRRPRARSREPRRLPPVPDWPARSCLASGECPVDPAHLLPRSLGCCRHAIAWWRSRHRAYDGGELDLLSHLEPRYRGVLARLAARRAGHAPTARHWGAQVAGKRKHPREEGERMNHMTGDQFARIPEGMNCCPHCNCDGLVTEGECGGLCTHCGGGGLVLVAERGQEDRTVTIRLAPNSRLSRRGGRSGCLRTQGPRGSFPVYPGSNVPSGPAGGLDA